jgi:hypothetical protein
MAKIKLNARTLYKFCKRHWKYVLATIAAGAAISAVGKAEYDAGLQDAGEMFEAGLKRAKELPDGTPQEEFDKQLAAAMVQKYSDMYE